MEKDVVGRITEWLDGALETAQSIAKTELLTGDIQDAAIRSKLHAIRVLCTAARGTLFDVVYGGADKKLLMNSKWASPKAQEASLTENEEV